MTEQSSLSLSPTDKKQSACLPEQDEVLNERYRLNKILGVGGMGVVYQASDLLLLSLGVNQSHFAIKMLTREAQEYTDAGLLLVNEFTQVQKLQHANILPINQIDICQQSHHAFIVMPKMEGEPLSMLLASPFGITKEKERFVLASSLILAVLHCHKKGVIHGDIKPENIMIDKNGHLTLFDFSISRSVNEKNNRCAIDFSKVHAWSGDYAAPEVLAGTAPTIKSDQYSLCVLLYKLIFNIRHNANETPMVIDKNLKYVPLQAILISGMQPDPNQRHVNFTELLSTLKVLKDELTQQRKNKFFFF
ncbi:serine/threonine protein kinase [Photobacterium lipolyticum]|uniref:non-specific serine/threonine protein kinase n=1 Tax=Photobacterium lipolyticum TaxID=266810 RepID=A0A2T3MYU1_9GAMM|nr:serine/threonine-protein kinase [Photobacterium lipolyticum]PSW05093.1 serine/threonine protein kinase [Photobacterium lipolyticum]